MHITLIVLWKLVSICDYIPNIVRKCSTDSYQDKSKEDTGDWMKCHLSLD